MPMMTDEQLSELRAFVADRAASASPGVRRLVDHLTTALSSIARRSMLPVDARDFLSDFSEFIRVWHGPQGQLPSLHSSVFAMLAELDQYGVTAEELRTLKEFCLGGEPVVLTGLRRSIDVAIFSRSFGVPLEPHHRVAIDAFVASECDSVALAASSLLRAVDAAEQGARRIDLAEGALVGAQRGRAQ